MIRLAQEAEKVMLERFGKAEKMPLPHGLIMDTIILNLESFIKEIKGN